MKKFALCVLSLLFAGALYAEIAIPAALAGVVDTVYEEVTSDDGAWTFVSAHVIQKNRNDIYSINNNTKEYFHVYANPQNRERTITNICFFPKTKKLYFNSHNNNSNVHGEWIPIGHGMYTLQKDADGNYSEKGLKRYALPAPWILQSNIQSNAQATAQNKEQDETDEKSNKPKNNTSDGAGRNGALREAKRKNGVPTSQPPEKQKN